MIRCAISRLFVRVYVYIHVVCLVWSKTIRAAKNMKVFRRAEILDAPASATFFPDTSRSAEFLTRFYSEYFLDATRMDSTVAKDDVVPRERTELSMSRMYSCTTATSERIKAGQC